MISSERNLVAADLEIDVRGLSIYIWLSHGWVVSIDATVPEYNYGIPFAYFASFVAL